MDVAPERQPFSEARKKQEREGCLFFWLLFVGQATKSDSPAGEKHPEKTKNKSKELDPRLREDDDSPLKNSDLIDY